MTLFDADRRLLSYRPWDKKRHSVATAIRAIARTSCVLLLRQRICWGLLGLALLAFFFFFYAQYLLVWISQQMVGEKVRLAGFTIEATNLLRFLDRLALNGSAHTFGNFIWFQGYILTILLAFGGARLFGNDQSTAALSFFLTKPITAWQYMLGKCLTIAVLVLSITFVPALILWIEAGLLFDWKTYYVDNFHLLVGITAYCLILTLALSVLLATAAILLQRTTPLILIWMGFFVLLRLMANWLTQANLDARWRLLDLWNNLYLCGMWCLGADHSSIRPTPQPEYWMAAVIVGMVILCCCTFLCVYLARIQERIV
jgi:ABC-type transport system involved in multi-copper enzyme maturation permease subunit